MRIGQGFDVHAFCGGRPLILGGVEIPYEKGLLGHSDADVLTHAVCDSLLGAGALGDIGKLFPDSSKEFEGICSLILLKKVGELVKENGYTIMNIDATIMAQKPKVAAFEEKMAENFASVLGIEKGKISIKATTQEGLGFVGREEGIAAMAVCLLN